MITKQMFRWHINTQVDNNNINNNYNKTIMIISTCNNNNNNHKNNLQRDYDHYYQLFPPLPVVSQKFANFYSKQ